VKTTGRGKIYPNSSIISQLAFDYGRNDVLWVFVNGEPSSTLVNLLDATQMPYLVWYE
jgi:hypothetical protein